MCSVWDGLLVCEDCHLLERNNLSTDDVDTTLLCFLYTVSGMLMSVGRMLSALSHEVEHLENLVTADGAVDVDVADATEEGEADVGT